MLKARFRSSPSWSRCYLLGWPKTSAHRYDCNLSQLLPCPHHPHHPRPPHNSLHISISIQQRHPSSGATISSFVLPLPRRALTCAHLPTETVSLPARGCRQEITNLGEVISLAKANSRSLHALQLITLHSIAQYREPPTGNIIFHLHERRVKVAK